MEFAQYVVDLIAQGLFPIAMCLMLIYVMVENSKAHKQEMDNIVKSLDNNTKAIELLSQKIDLEQKIYDLKESEE